MKYLKAISFFFIIPAYFSCNQPAGSQEISSSGTAFSDSSISKIINSNGQQIASRFNPPPNFIRVPADSNSFASFLRNFPLKKHNSKVYYYDGIEKPNQVYEAVLDIDVGEKDLQQCADAVMRLRAEYLFGQKLYDSIHFNFTNGFRADYRKWADGFRINIKGNKTSWYKATDPTHSQEEFKKYLEIVFSYAGTLSLSREMIMVPIEQMQVGDVFIFGGAPGHAVLVVDMAEDPRSGKKIFIIAQSYMPAQDIHILKNLNSPEISPWYETGFPDQLLTPEWTFEKKELMRFGV